MRTRLILPKHCHYIKQTITCALKLNTSITVFNHIVLLFDIFMDLPLSNLTVTKT